MNLEQESLAARIEYARLLATDIERFQEAFPQPNIPQTPLPMMTWEQLERQLKHLALTTPALALVPDRVSAMRRLAPYKPAEMVLQEILIEAFILLDERHQSDMPPTGKVSDQEAREGEMT